MFRNRSPRFACLAAAALGLSAASRAPAQVIVTPNALATVEGNTVIPPGGFEPFRFMQVISSSQFSSLPGPVFLTAFRFRPDATQPGPASVASPGAQFFFSTTSATVSTLSPNFAANIGPDNTLVRTFGPTGAMTTANLPGPGNTRQFDVEVTFTTPFLYDPSAGNLLFESQFPVFNLISGADNLYDGFSDFSPAAPGRSMYALGAPNLPTGTLQFVGLAMQFDYVPVPEPSSLALLSAAGLGLARYLRRRRVADQGSVRTTDSCTHREILS